MQLCVPTVLNISRYCILNKQDRYLGRSLFIAKTISRNICSVNLCNSPASVAHHAVWWLNKSLGRRARLLFWELGYSLRFCVENTRKCPLSIRLLLLVFEGLSIVYFSGAAISWFYEWHHFFLILLTTSFPCEPSVSSSTFSYIVLRVGPSVPSQGHCSSARSYRLWLFNTMHKHSPCILQAQCSYILINLTVVLRSQTIYRETEYCLGKK